jgi:hypothetical protein
MLKFGDLGDVFDFDLEVAIELNVEFVSSW